MGYIRVPLETNPITLAEDVYAYIQANAPGWTPNDGNLDTWIIKAFAFKAAEIRDLASDVPDSIAAWLGSTLFAIPPTDAASAVGNTTWTMIDNLGHVIPEGTFVGIRNSVGDLVTFETVNEVIVAPGDTVTAVGEVQIVATVPGTEANNLNQVPELITVLDWVSSVAIVGSTSGGADAETVDEYLDRLVRRLQLLTQTPILPAEFALAALDADPSVFRAVAIDGYDPDTDTYDNDRTVAIAGLEEDGDNISAPAKAAIETYIEAKREANFVVKTMDSNRTSIDVDTTFKILDGYDSTTVESDVEAALTDYLSPTIWGTDPRLSGNDALRSWIELDTVYYNELIVVVGNVDGVDRVVTLTVNKTGDPPGTANVVLDAPASITTVGTITAAVV